jgi:uncharacterized iron-regulated membrane protein
VPQGQLPYQPQLISRMFTLNSRSIRAWGWVHKWTSLISTLFILMLCITGLPLIFEHEIEHAMMPELEQVPANAPAPSLDSIVTAAEVNRPNEQALYLFFEQDEPLVLVSTAKSPMASPDDFYYQAFDLRNGHKVDMLQPTEGFMYLLRKLHVDMFAGLPGMLFLGGMAILMLIAIISGIVLYTPFMRKLDFGEIRQDKGHRARWLDLHNLLGIVTVVWLFVVGLTGAINTLGAPIEQIWQATELSEMASTHKDKPLPEQFASVDVVVDNIRKELPDLTLRTVAMPDTPFASSHHYGLYMLGTTAVTSRLLTPALADAETGEITSIRDMPMYVKTLFISQPLHFGDYGGLPLKILWAILDIITIVVLVSGLYLWRLRSRSKTNTDIFQEVVSEDIR